MFVCDSFFASDGSLHLPDFYVGNLHKWFLAPRGTGFLWCNKDKGPRDFHLGPSWRDVVRHPIVSHGEHAGFHSSFSWHGNVDYSPLLSLRAMVEDVWCAPHANEMMKYSHSLCADAADMLEQEWSSATYDIINTWGKSGFVSLCSAGVI